MKPTTAVLLALALPLALGAYNSASTTGGYNSGSTTGGTTGYNSGSTTGGSTTGYNSGSTTGGSTTGGGYNSGSTTGGTTGYNSGSTTGGTTYNSGTSTAPATYCGKATCPLRCYHWNYCDQGTSDPYATDPNYQGGSTTYNSGGRNLQTSSQGTVTSRTPCTALAGNAWIPHSQKKLLACHPLTTQCISYGYQWKTSTANANVDMWKTFVTGGCNQAAAVTFGYGGTGNSFVYTNVQNCVTIKNKAISFGKSLGYSTMNLQCRTCTTDKCNLFKVGAGSSTAPRVALAFAVAVVAYFMA